MYDRFLWYAWTFLDLYVKSFLYYLIFFCFIVFHFEWVYEYILFLMHEHLFRNKRELFISKIIQFDTCEEFSSIYTHLLFLSKICKKWFKIHEINKIHVSSKLMKNSSRCGRKEPSSSLEDGWKSLGNSVAFNYT
jgi:hypothetical protein